MKRIIYDVPRWSLYLHREARGIGMATEGDDGITKFGDELFEKLYTGGEGELLPEKQQDPGLRTWATELHATCDQLPAFQRLASEVRGDAYSAGLATERLLEELKPTLTKEADAQTLPAQALRRLVGRASDRAATAVEEAREAQEGLGGVTWGTGTSQAADRTSASARTLAQRLKHDHRLRRIAMLAGRFKRIAAQKQRTKVKHGADEITDVEQGADLGRLLPAELGRLVHPRLRLAFLADFLERKCLQYQLSGVETLGKGPLVVCLDKSGSMEGERDSWSTAVALALLDIAQRERRVFALLCFDGAVKFEVVVRPGEPLPEQALFVGCSGGTSIAAAVQRGLEIIREHPGQLRKADVMLITDGGSDVEPAPALREAAKQLGVSLLGCGIGVAPELLQPWCDEVQVVSDLATVSDQAAEQLFTR